jgi:hypothetical protein
MYEEEQPNPLCSLLQHYLKELSAVKWGKQNYNWVYVNTSKVQGQGSKVWTNICNSWTSSKAHLVPRDVINIEEWYDLPLWLPHIAHKNKKLAVCKTTTQRRICRSGMRQVGDVVDSTGRLLT